MSSSEVLYIIYNVVLISTSIYKLNFQVKTSFAFSVTNEFYHQVYNIARRREKVDDQTLAILHCSHAAIMFNISLSLNDSYLPYIAASFTLPILYIFHKSRDSSRFHCEIKKYIIFLFFFTFY